MLFAVALLLALAIVGIAVGLSTLNVQKSISIGGASLSENSTMSAITAVSSQELSPPVNYPLAQPGVLVQNYITGSMTMTNVNHGLVSGQRVDIYWTDVNGYRHVCYANTIGTVSGQGVSFTIGTGTGAGSSLPAEGAAIVVAQSTAYGLLVTGANAIAIVVNCSSINDCTVTFANSSGTDEFTVHVPAGQLYENRFSSGNPINGDAITQVFVSHTNQTYQAIVNVAVLTN